MGKFWHSASFFHSVVNVVWFSKLFGNINSLSQRSGLEVSIRLPNQLNLKHYLSIKVCVSIKWKYFTKKVVRYSSVIKKILIQGWLTPSVVPWELWVEESWVTYIQLNSSKQSTPRNYPRSGCFLAICTYSKTKYKHINQHFDKHFCLLSDVVMKFIVQNLIFFRFRKLKEITQIV